jgi:hypothetical protein
MKRERRRYVQAIVLILTLLIFLPAMRVIKEEEASYSGVIKSVDKDFKFIMVNDVKVILSEKTTVMDEKGNSLLKADLRTGLSVAIEGGRRPDGFFARKIVITTPKKKP